MRRTRRSLLPLALAAVTSLSACGGATPPAGGGSVSGALQQLGATPASFHVDAAITTDTSHLHGMSAAALLAYGTFAQGVTESGDGTAAAGALTERLQMAPGCAEPVTLSERATHSAVAEDGVWYRAASAGPVETNPLAIAAAAQPAAWTESATRYTTTLAGSSALLLHTGATAALRAFATTAPVHVEVTLGTSGAVTSLTATTSLTLDVTKLVSTYNGGPATDGRAPGGTLGETVTVTFTFGDPAAPAPQQPGDLSIAAPPPGSCAAALAAPSAAAGDSAPTPPPGADPIVTPQTAMPEPGW